MQLKDDAGKTRKRLATRQTDDVNDAEYNYYHERAKRFAREFRKRPAVKGARERGEGTVAELKDYQELKSDYNKFQRLQHKRTSQAKAARAGKSDPSTFTQEHVDYLHERFVERQRRRVQDREGMTRLKNRDPSLPTDVQKEYDNLVKDANEYMKWYRWNRGKAVQEHLPEDRAKLDANREGYLEYISKYIRDPAGKVEAAKLRARVGTPEELRAFDKLWEAWKAYTRVYYKYRQGGGKVEIEVPEGLSDVVEILEANRDKRNLWQKRYKDKALRDRMEAGDGTKTQLDEYHDLKEAALRYRRAYAEGARMMKGVADSGKTIKITSTGRTRYFKPNSTTRQRMKQNRKVSPKTNDGPGRPLGGSGGSSPPGNDQKPGQSTEGGTDTSNPDSPGQGGPSDTQPPLQSLTGTPRGAAFSESSTPLGWASGMAQGIQKMDPGTVATTALKGLAVAGGRAWDLLSN